MPGLGQRILPLLLVFFFVLAPAMPAAAQFVAPPPAAPILPPNVARSPGTQVGHRCQTRAGICVLNASAPLGSRCSCATSGGPILGQTIP